MGPVTRQRRGDDQGQVGTRDARKSVLQVCLSGGEKALLAEVARDMGLSLSSFARRVLLAKPLPPRRPPRPIPDLTQGAYIALANATASIAEIARVLGEGRTVRDGEVFEGLRLVAEAIGEVRAEILGAQPVADGDGAEK